MGHVSLRTVLVIISLALLGIVLWLRPAAAETLTLQYTPDDRPLWQEVYGRPRGQRMIGVNRCHTRVIPTPYGPEVVGRYCEFIPYHGRRHYAPPPRYHKPHPRPRYGSYPPPPRYRHHPRHHNDAHFRTAPPGCARVRAYVRRPNDFLRWECY